MLLWRGLRLIQVPRHMRRQSHQFTLMEAIHKGLLTGPCSRDMLTISNHVYGKARYNYVYFF